MRWVWSAGWRRWIDAVGVVSGLAPLDRGGAREGLTGRQRRARDGYLMLRRAPWLTRLVGWRMARHRHTADGGVTLVRSSMAPVDRARIDASPTLAAELRDNYRHAFLHGGRGVAQDLRVLCTGGWDFDPAEVAVPVWLWHGERDDNVPATDGRYLAGVLPRCHARFVADAGHLLFLDRSAQILAPWAET
jgi:pimeloyl-ACP methyl ester carboxylesterase